MIALPRDPNPYQEGLYAAMRAQGAQIRYAATARRSHTVNLVCLPLELALALRGFQILHVHWTFGFSLPFSDRFPILRRGGRWWFGVSWTAPGWLDYGSSGPPTTCCRTPPCLMTIWPPGGAWSRAPTWSSPTRQIRSRSSPTSV